MGLSIDDIRRRLAKHSPATYEPRPNTREAAVAIVLRERDETEVMFIHRAQKAGDPWSGHMAFPGGHAEDDDDTLLATAMRETLEEVGLDLRRHGEHIGTVDHQRAMPRGRPLNMLIAPYVFAVGEHPALSPNYEVAEVVWAPLAPIVSGDSLTEEARIVGGTPTTFSGHRLPGGHFVWGLTFRMLQSFFDAVK